MKNTIRKIKKYIAVAILSVGLFNTMIVNASGLQGSKLVTGTQAFLGDAALVLQTYIAIPLAIVMFLFFGIKRAMQEEDHDKKKYENLMKGVVVILVIIELAAEIMKVAVGYYK